LSLVPSAVPLSPILQESKTPTAQSVIAVALTRNVGFFCAGEITVLEYFTASAETAVAGMCILQPMNRWSVELSLK
jgi:hypothetical protein